MTILKKILAPNSKLPVLHFDLDFVSFTDGSDSKSHPKDAPIINKHNYRDAFLNCFVLFLHFMKIRK